MAVYRVPTDKRMKWIRMLEIARRKKVSERYKTNYELVSECNITRRTWFENGLIACQALGRNNYIEKLYNYELQITNGYADPYEYNTKGGLVLVGSKKGYYSLSQEDEIVSLLSLFSHSRFTLVSSRQGTHTAKSIATSFGDQFVYLPCNKGWIRKSEIFQSKNKDMWEFSNFLKKVIRLDSHHHQKFYYAVSNYANALRIIGFQDEIAYIRFISAINSLSKTSLGDRKGFIEFILSYCNGYFSTKRPSWPRSWVTEENLEKYLNIIYEARSRYLHQGVPLCISEVFDYFDEMGRGHYLDLAVGKMVDQRVWGKFDMLPNILFFESLVRHCLLNYLERNQAHTKKLN